jgi:hypothetical protein
MIPTLGIVYLLFIAVEDEVDGQNGLWMLPDLAIEVQALTKQY